MRSFLRWAGSKRSILPALKRYWPGGGRAYIEPFCGSSCLFFDLAPKQAILGDLNVELTTALRLVKKDPTTVLESIRRFPKGERGYYAVRQLDPWDLAEGDRAARFIYLNRYCFNGIYRTNSKGIFNVPYGPPRSGKPVDEALIMACSKALRNALLVHGDFEQTLEHAKPGDFVYLDPPYFISGRRVFHEYTGTSFSAHDLNRLSAQLDRLDELGAVFLVSYGDSPEARHLLSKWHPQRIRVRRNIAGFGPHRRAAYELMASNKPHVAED